MREATFEPGFQRHHCCKRPVTSEDCLAGPLERDLFWQETLFTFDQLDHRMRILKPSGVAAMCMVTVVPSIESSRVSVSFGRRSLCLFFR